MMLKSLLSQAILIAYCCISASPVTGSVLCFEKDGKVKLEEVCNDGSSVSPIIHFQAVNENPSLHDTSISNDHCGACLDIPIKKLEEHRRLLKDLLNQLHISILLSHFNLPSPRASRPFSFLGVQNYKLSSSLNNLVLRI